MHQEIEEGCELEFESCLDKSEVGVLGDFQTTRIQR